MIVLKSTYEAALAEIEKLKAENAALAWKVLQYKKKFREEG